jgi:hypothetical protein
MPHSIASNTTLSAIDKDVGSIALPALPVKMYKPKPAFCFMTIDTGGEFLHPQ